MSSRLFDWGRDGFLEKELAWVADTQQAMLLDMTQVDTWLKQITAASNATPIVVTSNGHGFSNGDIVVINGVLGNLSANGTWKIANVAANTFELQTLESVNSVGFGAYVSGGSAIDLTQAKFVADINAGRIGTDATVPGRSSSGGVANATDWSWLAVTGNAAQAVILLDAAGGSDATNRLVAFIDGKIRVIADATANAAATTIVVEPLRGDLLSGTVLTFSNGKQASLSANGVKGDRTLTVTALANAIQAGSTADAITTNAGLPVTPPPFPGGTITFTVDTSAAKLFTL